MCELGMRINNEYHVFLNKCFKIDSTLFYVLYIISEITLYKIHL